MNSAGNRVQLFLVSQLHDKGRNAVLDCIVWIKVRSAGHDIPRSTDRWRPERDGHRLRNRTWLVTWRRTAIPPPIDMSVFASLLLCLAFSTFFTEHVTFVRSIEPFARNLVVNVEKRCCSNTRLMIYRLLTRREMLDCCLPGNWFRIARYLQRFNVSRQE